MGAFVFAVLYDVGTAYLFCGGNVVEQMKGCRSRDCRFMEGSSFCMGRSEEDLKKVTVILITWIMLIASFALMVPAAGASTVETERQIDSGTGATPNYRTFHKSDLKAMPVTGGNYTCLKSQPPYTYFTQDWFGVKLAYFLDVEVGLKEGTTGIKFIAEDDYSITLTLDEIRNANPKGLYAILGWKNGEVNTTGGPYTELDEEEGPIRLVPPQSVVGPKDQGGVPNWNKSVRWLRAIEVQPTPPGLPPVDPSSIPPGELIVYGNILNRKSFTVDQLKSMKSYTGTYHWEKEGNEGDKVCTGIPIDFLQNSVLGTRTGTTGTEIIAADNFVRTLDNKQIDGSAYPSGLPALLAWNIDGKDLAAGRRAAGEGPLQFIKPQESPTDGNLSRWVKSVRNVNVLPDADNPKPDVAAIPSDRVVASGNIDPNNIPSYWYLAEGYTGGGFEEYICICNPNSWETKVIIEYQVEGEDSKTQPEMIVPPRSRTTVKVNDAVGMDKNVSATVEGYHSDSIVVERAMYWNGRSGGHCAAGVTDPAASWYLAEGCTSQGFETWVLMQNPGDDEAQVDLTYMTGTGKKSGPSFKLAGHSRKTVDVAEIMPNEVQVSTRVASTKPIIAERAMYWNGRAGGHCAVGVQDPGKEWYLAEGSTNNFETWILLQNAGGSKATAQLTYMTPGGEKEGPQVVLDPGSRQTVNVADKVANEDSISTKIVSDQPIIAERAMYWNNRKGGHCEHGSDYPKFRSYLAEGATDGGFETWILVQNPSPVDATVYITYLTDKGAQEKAPLQVPSNTRVSINALDDVGANFNVSAQVYSQVPVCVERAVYWSGRVEGSCANGYPTW